MVIQPKIRGFICTNAHPVGCAAHVQEQIDYVKAKGPVAGGPKNVLVIGASTGYGLASRITSAFASGAKTLGIFFEKEPTEGKTASAGWYNTVAFEQAATAAGLWNKHLNGDAFTDELIARLPQYMDKKAGNLLLFASYWQMQKVVEALRVKGWSFLVQGEASRQSLLELHALKVKAGEGSILCGTQSFSEGLDLPGALLTNLVITKLPFAVPSSPLEEALSEAITKRGGNPFLQMTVPATARKLVQACGRLLRQEMDHGRIVILDRRLVTKTYGKAMLKALPPFSQTIEE